MRILLNLRHEVETKHTGVRNKISRNNFPTSKSFYAKYIEICNFFVKNEQKYKGRIHLEGSGSLRRDQRTEKICPKQHFNRLL